MRNLREELDNVRGDYPEAWRPEPGDVLVGRLVRYDKAKTPYGERDIAVVHDEDLDTDISVWLIHTVLIGEFKEQQPKVGDRLAIKRFTDSQKGYRRYTLVVERQEASGE